MCSSEEQQSPTFLASGMGFMEDNFSTDRDRGRGDGFGMSRAHYTYSALCFYYYISSTSDQALDPGVWGPQLYRGASLTLHYQLEGF